MWGALESMAGFFYSDKSRIPGRGECHVKRAKGIMDFVLWLDRAWLWLSRKLANRCVHCGRDRVLFGYLSGTWECPACDLADGPHSCESVVSSQ